MTEPVNRRPMRLPTGIEVTFGAEHGLRVKLVDGWVLTIVYQDDQARARALSKLIDADGAELIAMRAKYSQLLGAA